jgi:hypothetical protein
MAGGPAGEFESAAKKSYNIAAFENQPGMLSWVMENTDIY